MSIRCVLLALKVTLKVFALYALLFCDATFVDFGRVNVFFVSRMLTFKLIESVSVHSAELFKRLLLDLCVFVYP